MIVGIGALWLSITYTNSDSNRKQTSSTTSSRQVYAKQQGPPRNTRASSLNKDEEDNEQQSVEITGEQINVDDNAKHSASVRSSVMKPKQTATSSSTQPSTASPSYSFQQDGKRKTINYSAERVIGSGSFGIVFLAKVFETGESVAIKKVLQDKRFKNRELQIMKMLSHTNVVEMKHCFFSKGEKVSFHSE